MLCFVAQHLMRVMRLPLVILCVLRYAARAHTSLYLLRYRRYQYGTVGTRERNLLARPTLDMYLPLVCFGAGARGPGSLGLAPVVATASFPLINLPKFYLSFTILVSLILVKYPDRVGLTVYR